MQGLLVSDSSSLHRQFDRRRRVIL